MDILHFIKEYQDGLRAAEAALEQSSLAEPGLGLFSRDLAIYLELERDYLYPEIQDLFAGAATLVQIGEGHAATISRRLKLLLKAQESHADLLAPWADLKAALAQHFDAEEKHLLPKMRTMIRTEDREELGQVFVDARDELRSRQDKPGAGGQTVRRRA